mgnify:FL=1
MVTGQAVTQAAYARARGVSREAVSRAVKAGRISTVDGKRINPAVADVEWAANTKARADGGTATTPVGQFVAGAAKAAQVGGGATPSGGGGYWADRARREKIEADLADLRLQQERGELINKAGAERAYEAAVRLLRDAVFGVPDRLPFPRDQQIQVRDALISAMADVAKMLGGVSRE